MTGYHSLSDLELADLLKLGDPEAFAEIYERYFGVLYLHAYHRLRDKDEAKDLIQELFYALWSKRETLDFRSNFSHYLYTWVRNRIINAISHKQVEAKYISAALTLNAGAEELTDHLVRERQLAAIIEGEIKSLPPKMREVFELSRKSNLTHKAIAEQLDISEQTVRSHVKNALKILRTKLGIVLYLFFIFYR